MYLSDVCLNGHANAVYSLHSIVVLYQNFHHSGSGPSTHTLLAHIRQAGGTL